MIYRASGANASGTSVKEFTIAYNLFILMGDSAYTSATGASSSENLSGFVTFETDNSGNKVRLPAVRHGKRRGNFAFADGQVVDIYGPELIRGEPGGTEINII